MSLKCCKAMTLVVVDVPTPIHYWPMYSLPAPDVISGLNLNLLSGSPGVGAGIITAGITFLNTGFPVVFDVLQTAGTMDLAAFPNGFTWRFWAKATEGPPKNISDATLVHYHSWRLQGGFCSGGLTFGGSISVGSAYDSNWHRLIGYWNPSTLTMAYKLDNEPTVTKPVYGGMDLGAAVIKLYAIGSPPPDFITICEMAFWDNVLTETQMLSDWNNGFGISWPW